MWYKVKKIYVGTQQVRPEKIPLNWLLWYWKLQSDLTDYSGNGNNGSWNGNTWTFETVWWYTWARLTENSSWKTTVCIDTPVKVSTQDITLCWWIRFSSLLNWEYLMWDTQSNLWKRYDNYIYLQWFNGSSWLNFLLDNNAPSTWVWYFRCVSVTNNQATFYLNNNKIKTTQLSWTRGTWHTFQIGSNGVSWEWTNWWVRHCAIYNRWLTDAEALQFYNNTK